MALARLLRQLLEHRRPRVHRRVHRVTEAHDLLVALEPVAHVRLGVLRRADLLEHLHRLFVRAAVQRSFERRHRAGDRAEHVGERGRDDPRRERGGVHRVVRVEDERGVERVGVLGARLVPQEHPQEVGGVGQLRVGRQDVLAGAQPVVVRDQRRGLRDQAERLAELGLGRSRPSRRGRTRTRRRCWSAAWTSATSAARARASGSTGTATARARRSGTRSARRADRAWGGRGGAGGRRPPRSWRVAARSAMSYPTYHRRPRPPSISEICVSAATTSRSPLSVTSPASCGRSPPVAGHEDLASLLSG